MIIPVFEEISKCVLRISHLPNGIFANMGSALAGSLQPSLPISVMMTVGFTQFTRILCGPSSKAITRVRLSRAPLVAQYTAWSFSAACDACDEILTITPGVLVFTHSRAMYWLILITAFTFTENDLEKSR